MTAYIKPTNGFNLEAYFNIVFATSAGIPRFDAALGVLGVVRGEDGGCPMGLGVLSGSVFGIVRSDLRF